MICKRWLSAIWENTAPVRWIRCEPSGEHIIHWTCAVFAHIARKMNNVCIFPHDEVKHDIKLPYIVPNLQLECDMSWYQHTSHGENHSTECENIYFSHSIIFAGGMLYGLGTDSSVMVSGMVFMLLSTVIMFYALGVFYVSIRLNSSVPIDNSPCVDFFLPVDNYLLATSILYYFDLIGHQEIIIHSTMAKKSEQLVNGFPMVVVIVFMMAVLIIFFITCIS